MNRNDHIVPEGYLRGFVHPQGSGQRGLWVLNLATLRWSEKTAGQFAYERGFYDYSPDAQPVETADEAFATLERTFPEARKCIRANRAAWPAYRVTLVSFAVMLSARSHLFRHQSTSTILPSLADRSDADQLAKNFSITTMRSEMKRRAEEWLGYDWVLGYTEDPNTPVIASDQSVVMTGAHRDQLGAYASRDFWLSFPVSWDMLLIGSSIPLDAPETRQLSAQELAEFHSVIYEQARRFIVSPIQLWSVPPNRAHLAR
jgi:hypothetical protein